MNEPSTTPAANGLEQQVASLIVEALLLEDINPVDLSGKTPLFTDEQGDGLGLDSIDVLELAMALNKRFGIKVDAENEHNREIFSTIGSLAAFVDAQQQA